MKSKKKYRELTPEEIEQQLRERLKERFDTMVKKQSGKLDNPLLLRTLRRDIARIKTALRERRAQAGS